MENSSPQARRQEKNGRQVRKGRKIPIDLEKIKSSLARNEDGGATLQSDKEVGIAEAAQPEVLVHQGILQS